MRDQDISEFSLLLHLQENEVLSSRILGMMGVEAGMYLKAPAV